MNVPPNRKKPFSHKQKREQLKLKKQKKRNKYGDGGEPAPSSSQREHAGSDGDEERLSGDESITGASDGLDTVDAMGYEVNSAKQRSRREQLRTRFKREAKEDKGHILARSHIPIDLPSSYQLSWPSDEFVWTDIEIPRRPAWTYDMTKQQVELNEVKVFSQWIKSTDAVADVNKYEHNLEVWRQLWRVLEVSDLLLLVVDARYPTLHLPASFVNYISMELKKHVVIVLNKCDLVGESLVLRWCVCLRQMYPGVTAVVPFTSYKFEDHHLLASAMEIRAENQIGTKRRKKRRAKDVAGAEAIFGAIARTLGVGERLAVPSVIPFSSSSASEGSDSDYESLTSSTAVSGPRGAVGDGVGHGLTPDHDDDGDDWAHEKHGKRGKKKNRNRRKRGGDGTTEKERRSGDVASEDEGGGGDGAESAVVSPALSGVSVTVEDVEEGSGDAPKPLTLDSDEDEGEHMHTVGLIGQPNVGKSSVLNALVGRSAVSVSRTPGHTKHFQTVHIASNIRLCDCPGLVFPYIGMPKHIQALFGLLPISQLPDPFSAVRVLLEHVPIINLYRLDLEDAHKHTGEETDRWTPWSICEALAVKRHYLSARSARPDVYRAARVLLTDALDGVTVYKVHPSSSQCAASTERERQQNHQDRQRGERELALLSLKDKDEDVDDSESQSTHVSQKAALNLFELLENE